MEFLDVTDEKGNKIGIVKARKDVHHDGDFHRSVHVWLINSKQELLVQKRALTKKVSPGCWSASAAGHVSAGGGRLRAP